MKLFTLTATLLFWGSLATAQVTLPEIAQLPVVHQGMLVINGVVVPTVVHYHAVRKVYYIVVIRFVWNGMLPLFIYEVPQDTLLLEEVWHDKNTES